MNQAVVLKQNQVHSVHLCSLGTYHVFGALQELNIVNEVLNKWVNGKAGTWNDACLVLKPTVFFH